MSDYLGQDYVLCLEKKILCPFWVSLLYASTKLLLDTKLGDCTLYSQMLTPNYTQKLIQITSMLLGSLVHGMVVTFWFSCIPKDLLNISQKTQIWVILTLFHTLCTQAAIKASSNASGSHLCPRAAYECTQQICSTMQMCCLVCVSSPTHLKPRQAATAACISSNQVCKRGGGGTACAHIHIYTHIHKFTFIRTCKHWQQTFPYTVCSYLSTLLWEVFHCSVMLSKALHPRILMLMCYC